MRTYIAACVLGLVTTCTHVNPAEMTVDEHRNEAEVHKQRASEERAQFDPSATMRAAPRPPGSDPFNVPGSGLGSFNPTEQHLRAADQELQASNEHLVAAKSLLAFEHRACEGMSDAERSACPLFASKVSVIELVKTGFTLTFQSQVDVGQTYRRLNCHLAYATATGFDRPSCPLFLKGTRLERVNERSIAFIGESPAVTAALHAEARRLFLGLVSSSAAPTGDARGSRLFP